MTAAVFLRGVCVVFLASFEGLPEVSWILVTSMKGYKICTSMILGEHLISENYQPTQSFKGRFGTGSKNEYVAAKIRCFTMPGVRFPRCPAGIPFVLFQTADLVESVDRDSDR